MRLVNKWMVVPFVEKRVTTSEEKIKKISENTTINNSEKEKLISNILKNEATQTETQDTSPTNQELDTVQNSPPIEQVDETLKQLNNTFKDGQDYLPPADNIRSKTGPDKSFLSLSKSKKNKEKQKQKQQENKKNEKKRKSSSIQQTTKRPKLVAKRLKTIEPPINQDQSIAEPIDIDESVIEPPKLTNLTTPKLIQKNKIKPTAPNRIFIKEPQFQQSLTPPPSLNWTSYTFDKSYREPKPIWK